MRKNHYIAPAHLRDSWVPNTTGQLSQGRASKTALTALCPAGCLVALEMGRFCNGFIQISHRFRWFRSLIRLGSTIPPPPEDDDDVSFPELPAEKHWLVKDPEFGLVCKRCRHKGSSQFFTTFLCVGDPPKPTPKVPVEVENAPAQDSGHAFAPSSPSGKKQDAAVDSAEGVLEKGKGFKEALELERLEFAWLQQQLDELEMDNLEKEYLELAMQESMMEHELEMADKVDYGDEKPFNPCAKMRGVPKIVGVGASGDGQEEFDEIEYEFVDSSDEEKDPKDENPNNKENKICPHQDTRRPPASPCTSKRLPAVLSTTSLLARALSNVHMLSRTLSLHLSIVLFPLLL